MLSRKWLACASVLFAVGCSSSSGGNAGGGPDGGGSDGTTDGMQSGSEGGPGPDAAGDSGGGTGDAPSDTGSGGDSMGTPDSPYDAPPGDATSCGVTGNAICNGYCVDTYDDIHNCGGCNVVCQGPNPYCDNGHCTTPPCDGGVACGTSTFCCGTECCMAGQLCCDVPSNIPSFPKCTAPVNGTCPVGCLGCP